MRRSWAIFSCVCAAACAGALGCGGSTDTSITAPTTIQPRCQPSFDAAPRSFAADGGTGTLAVSVARECSWSASSGAAWVVVTGGSQGQGDGVVAFRVDRNPDPVSRSSAIVVGEGRLDVAQQPAACGFQVGRPDQVVPATGGTVQLDVRTHAACAWTAASETAWAIVAPASGRGASAVSITVAVNTGSARSGFVSVAGERFQVTQAATAPAPSPPPAPNPTPPPPPSPTPPPPPPPPPPPAPEPIEVELSGRVDDLSGSCPNLRFVVRGTVIVTNNKTNFRHGSCRDLEKRTEVNVIGRRLADGSVEAREVEMNR